MTQIRDYVLTKSKQNEKLHAKLRELLSAGSKKEVGLILSDRFINMPVETAPPMWRMMLEEVKWAVDEVRRGKTKESGVKKDNRFVSRIDYCSSIDILEYSLGNAFQL